MSAPARLCWLRISLRTLFVLTAVVAACLAYPLSWIHPRKRFLAENSSLIHSMGVNLWSGMSFRIARPPELPLVLRAFGQRPVKD